MKTCNVAFRLKCPVAVTGQHAEHPVASLRTAERHPKHYILKTVAVEICDGQFFDTLLQGVQDGSRLPERSIAVAEHPYSGS
jgi:hypothetical protein